MHIMPAIWLGHASKRFSPTLFFPIYTLITQQKPNIYVAFCCYYSFVVLLITIIAQAFGKNDAVISVNFNFSTFTVLMVLK
jgi:hypothetical protein